MVIESSTIADRGFRSSRISRSDRAGGARFSMELDGLKEFRRLLKQLPSDQRGALGDRMRAANNKSAEIVAEEARKIVPQSGNQHMWAYTGKRLNKTKNRTIAGTIKTASTRTEARVIAGKGKQIWWAWMRHAGSTDTKTKFRGGNTNRYRRLAARRTNIDYPPGVPYLRYAAMSRYKDIQRIHAAETDKVVRWFNHRHGSDRITP